MVCTLGIAVFRCLLISPKTVLISKRGNWWRISVLMKEVTMDDLSSHSTSKQVMRIYPRLSEEHLSSPLEEDDGLLQNGLNEQGACQGWGSLWCSSSSVCTRKSCNWFCNIWSVVFACWLLYSVVFVPLKAHMLFYLGATLHLGGNLSISKICLSWQFTWAARSASRLLSSSELTTKKEKNVSVGLNFSIIGKEILSQQHAILF